MVFTKAKVSGSSSSGSREQGNSKLQGRMEVDREALGSHCGWATGNNKRGVVVGLQQAGMAQGGKVTLGQAAWGSSSNQAAGSNNPNLNSSSSSSSNRPQ
jgi:hypothetical protein